METWEYLVDDEITLKEGKERMQAQLDEQGLEGWELVSIMPQPSTGSAQFLAVYKRPIRTVPAAESTLEKSQLPSFTFGRRKFRDETD
jgi:hypothetical protein